MVKNLLGVSNLKNKDWTRGIEAEGSLTSLIYASQYQYQSRNVKLTST